MTQIKPPPTNPGRFSLPTDSRFRHWHEKAFKNCPASLSRKGTDIYIKISSSCKTDESAQESKIDYTESDNQLASETCLKQPVDNAVYDITLTHGDGSKNVLYCMNRKIFKDKIEAHCLAYEKKNGKITGTVIIKTGFNQAVMCQPTITIRLP